MYICTVHIYIYISTPPSEAVADQARPAATGARSGR